jgi:hypothetical protein
MCGRLGWLAALLAGIGTLLWEIERTEKQGRNQSEPNNPGLAAAGRHTLILLI